MSIFSCGRAEPDDREELTSYVTRKVVVVGDGEVGKTSLLARFVTNEFDDRYIPTIFENQAAAVISNGKKVMLNLFDTAGQETYEHLRPLMYPETDVILICFSVSNPGSLINVVDKWEPEVRLHLTKTPILLVGLKTDLRSTSDLSPEVTQNLTSPDSVLSNHGDKLCKQRFVSYTQGQKIAVYIGAKAYFECSSKFNEGLTPIFQEAARLSLITRRRSCSIRGLLKFGRPKASFI